MKNCKNILRTVLVLVGAISFFESVKVLLGRLFDRSDPLDYLRFPENRHGSRAAYAYQPVRSFDPRRAFRNRF